MSTDQSDRKNIKRALISVYDKTGLDDLARALDAAGVEIVSTGSTAATIAGLGINVTPVETLTGFPECLEGRVKTLHPRVHAGILADTRKHDHLDQLANLDIEPFQLVVVNLYPFTETVASGADFDACVEQIDIGGPSMVRAAAKNHPSVAVVVAPARYGEVIDALAAGGFTRAERTALAVDAFRHTAAYDVAVATWLGNNAEAGTGKFPAWIGATYELSTPLRYGENPHQQAAFYRDVYPFSGCLSNYTQLQGKELSYNNIADADAAWEAVKSFDAPACVIVKHANPCGVAVADSPLAAYRLAYATDTTSAFGGIIAFNREVDGATAQQITDNQFMEVIMSPAFTADALAILAAKKNVRVLQIPLLAGANRFELKRVGGGLLVQTPDIHRIAREDLRVVSKRQPTEQEWADLLFVWNVAKFVKSNAIVFGKGGQTYGIGAGQMSRVDSTRIAARKAQDAGLDLNGACAASDAFFPFRDGVDVIAEQGIKAIIHPAGSVRDEEVFAAADEHGIAMVVTGVRHFRH